MTSLQGPVNLESYLIILYYIQRFYTATLLSKKNGFHATFPTQYLFQIQCSVYVIWQKQVLYPVNHGVGGVGSSMRRLAISFHFWLNPNPQSERESVAPQHFVSRSTNSKNLSIKSAQSEYTTLTIRWRCKRVQVRTDH